MNTGRANIEGECGGLLVEDFDVGVLLGGGVDGGADAGASGDTQAVGFDGGVAGGVAEDARLLGLYAFAIDEDAHHYSTGMRTFLRH